MSSILNFATCICMQEILQEYPHLDHQYSRRLASVYHDLTDEQAQHLAHRHDRASEYTS